MPKNQPRQRPTSLPGRSEVAGEATVIRRSAKIVSSPPQTQIRSNFFISNEIETSKSWHFSFAPLAILKSVQNNPRSRGQGLP